MIWNSAKKINFDVKLTIHVKKIAEPTPSRFMQTLNFFSYYLLPLEKEEIFERRLVYSTVRT